MNRAKCTDFYYQCLVCKRCFEHARMLVQHKSTSPCGQMYPRGNPGDYVPLDQHLEEIEKQRTQEAALLLIAVARSFRPLLPQTGPSSSSSSVSAHRNPNMALTVTATSTSTPTPSQSQNPTAIQGLIPAVSSLTLTAPTSTVTTTATAPASLVLASSSSSASQQFSTVVLGPPTPAPIIQQASLGNDPSTTTTTTTADAAQALAVSIPISYQYTQVGRSKEDGDKPNNPRRRLLRELNTNVSYKQYFEGDPELDHDSSGASDISYAPSYATPPREKKRKITKSKTKAGARKNSSSSSSGSPSLESNRKRRKLFSTSSPSESKPKSNSTSTPKPNPEDHGKDRMDVDVNMEVEKLEKTPPKRGRAVKLSSKGYKAAKAKLAKKKCFPYCGPCHRFFPTERTLEIHMRSDIPIHHSQNLAKKEKEAADPDGTKEEEEDTKLGKKRLSYYKGYRKLKCHPCHAVFHWKNSYRKHIGSSRHKQVLQILAKGERPMPVLYPEVNILDSDDDDRDHDHDNGADKKKKEEEKTDMDMEVEEKNPASSSQQKQSEAQVDKRTKLVWREPRWVGSGVNKRQINKAGIKLPETSESESSESESDDDKNVNAAGSGGEEDEEEDKNETDESITSDVADGLGFDGLGIHRHYCPICGKGFYSKNTLSSHMLLHDEDDDDDDDDGHDGHDGDVDVNVDVEEGDENADNSNPTDAIANINVNLVDRSSDNDDDDNANANDDDNANANEDDNANVNDDDNANANANDGDNANANANANDGDNANARSTCAVCNLTIDAELMEMHMVSWSHVRASQRGQGQETTKYRYSRYETDEEEDER